MPALLLILSMLLSMQCFSQRKLILTKSRGKSAQYHQGEKITFYLKDEGVKITDYIRGFTDSTIIFKDYSIDPRKISHVYIDDKTINWYFLKFKYEKLCLIAGAGYFLLDVVNTGEINAGTAMVSGSMLAAAGIFRLCIKKRIPLGGRRRTLHII
jgi:hypothetical protein